MESLNAQLFEGVNILIDVGEMRCFLFGFISLSVVSILERSSCCDCNNNCNSSNDCAFNFLTKPTFGGEMIERMGDGEREARGETGVQLGIVDDLADLFVIFDDDCLGFQF
jgi:hypothetical protein